jgi:hypothetical protein
MTREDRSTNGQEKRRFQKSMVTIVGRMESSHPLENLRRRLSVPIQGQMKFAMKLPSLAGACEPYMRCAGQRGGSAPPALW